MKYPFVRVNHENLALNDVRRVGRPLADELRSLDLSYNELQVVPEALRPLRALHWLSLHG